MSACPYFLVAAMMASPPEGGQAERPESVYDRIWGYTRLHENEESPILQSLALSGRFQVDYGLVDADQGSHDEWNVRRFRFGAKARLFRDFTVHGEIEVNPQERDPFYMRMTDLYLQWSRSERLLLTVGKHGAAFTMDGSTSSKELIAIDRSNLSNNLWFTTEYFPGMSVEGERGAWAYQAGLYSSGSENREFGNFDGDLFGLVVVGYDLAERLGVKEAVLAGNYVRQGADEDNTFTRRFGTVGSVNFKLQAARWGLRTDLAAGDGHLGQSDVWGAMAMPFFDLGRGFQLVARYTYVESEEPNGVRLATYESRVVPGRGDEFQELYLGLNYYFYDHKLKLQSGVQLAEMEDGAGDGGAYSGIAWTTGLRVSW